MPGKRKFGRKSIFRDKEGGGRVQGDLTLVGLLCFERARVRLARIAVRKVPQVSDADVIEYLARGEQKTRDYVTGRADGS